MPIIHSWLLEGRVILLEAEGALAEEDFEQIDTAMGGYFDEATARRVHVIIDATQVVRLPSLRAFSNSRWLRDHRLGWLLIVGLNHRAGSVTLDTAIRLMRLPVYRCETIAEGVRFLQENDDSLPDLTAGTD